MGNSQSIGHIDTVLATVARRYERLEARQDEQRGYLTYMALSEMGDVYGLSPNHTGTLFILDENHDGRFTVDKIKRFAREVYKQTRQISSRDTAHVIQGACTLSLWYSLQQPGGKQKFVDWMLAVCCQGYLMEELPGGTHVETGALKAMHTFVDMQRNTGVVWRDFYDKVEIAAKQQKGYINFETPQVVKDTGKRSAHKAKQEKPEGGTPHKHRWVPMHYLHLVAEAYADGISRMMGQFLGDEVTLKELKAVDAHGDVGIFGVGGVMMLNNSSTFFE